MAYRIAGIDVHKKMLAVVIADVAAEGDYRFERRRFGSGPQELRTLSGWLAEQHVEEVVMESTAQYWKPVWNTLQRYWQPMCGQPAGAGTKMGKLHLAQAQSNRGAQGRKRDFPDAERLVRRLVSQELVLSFVPDGEQRLWRTLMRRKYQLTRSRVQLHNRLESLLEETQIKLSSLVSDLLGVSGRRILRAIAEGYSDPVALADLADRHLRATGEQLRDALEPAAELNGVYRRLLKMVLEELEMIERQKAQMEQEMAMLLSPYQDTVQRLAEVPGLGVDSAQQILAEVGVMAATFPSAKKLASWVGICPGFEESAGISKRHRCPNGNRHMRRILNQCALASVRVKGSIFQLLYRRLIPRLGHKQAIGAVAHRLCRLIWMILHRGVRYLEMGAVIDLRAQQQRAQKMIRALRSLGYRVERTTRLA